MPLRTFYNSQNHDTSVKKKNLVMLIVRVWTEIVNVLITFVTISISMSLSPLWFVRSHYFDFAPPLF